MLLWFFFKFEMVRSCVVIHVIYVSIIIIIVPFNRLRAQTIKNVSLLEKR
jgi:hypothetical protein